MTKEITISLGKGGEIKVDLDKLQSEAVKDYIFLYGLKQMLNDVHAGEKEASAKAGLSQKKLDSLYRGEVAQARVGGGDPVAKIMRELALADITKQVKAAGKKMKDLDKEKLQAAIAMMMKKHEAAYRKTAEERLAVNAPSVKADDIMDLFD